VSTTIQSSLVSESGDIRLDINYANTTLYTTPNTQLVIVLNTGVNYLSDTYGGVYDPDAHSVTFSLGDLTGLSMGSIVISAFIQS